MSKQNAEDIKSRIEATKATIAGLEKAIVEMEDELRRERQRQT